jgi:hypothetical protein
VDSQRGDVVIVARRHDGTCLTAVWTRATLLARIVHDEPSRLWRRL